LLIFVNHSASAEFFSTMRMPVIAGRTFSETDTISAPQVAVVNETFVREHPAHQNPIGKVLTIAQTPESPERRYEIVGVVKDAKYRSLNEEPLPQVLLASSQENQPSLFMRLLVRTRIGAGEATREINDVLSSLSPRSTVVFRVLRGDVKEGLLFERLMATLSLTFAFLATVLAALGLYGVVSYTLARRTNEIGVRIALGASKSQVVRMILSEAGQLVLTGVIIGAAIAAATSRFAAAMFFGLKPYVPR
jgi:putative ABC transport system permease protein